MTPPETYKKQRERGGVSKKGKRKRERERETMAETERKTDISATINRYPANNIINE